MRVYVPQYMSIRHCDYLVVSADGWCRGGFRTREAAQAHADKSLTKILAGGQELTVVVKAEVTIIS